MQSLTYDTSGTETIAIWPDVTSSINTNPSASYDMVLSSDYGLQETIVSMSLDSIPTEVNPRLIFTLNKSDLPNYTGNYTYIVREGTPIVVNERWFEADETWSAYAVRWNGTAETQFTTIETDRAWIEGNDVPTFTEYNVPSTPGQYSIYHN